MCCASVFRHAFQRLQLLCEMLHISVDLVRIYCCAFVVTVCHCFTVLFIFEQHLFTWQHLPVLHVVLPVLHANFIIVCGVEAELFVLESSTSGPVWGSNLIVVTFFLLLWHWPWTQWPFNTSFTCIPWRYAGCANMNFLRQDFWKLSSDRETDRHDQNYIPCHSAGGQK